MARVFLALGSNLGDREAHLAAAVRALAESGFQVVGESSVYETDPVGGPEQGAYLNQAVEADTTLSPESALQACLQVEKQRGRERRERWGPRTLDVDLLLWDALVLHSEQLSLPHPRMHQRRFVLVPLCELAPQARHPVLQASLAELLTACPDHSRVELFSGSRTS